MVSHLKHSSTGAVVIRDGQSPATGARDIGFFSIGGGGGFSGGFGGGSSRKRARKRARAMAQALAEEQARQRAAALAQSQALAQAQAREAHRQLVASYSSVQQAQKAEIDLRFSARARGLPEALQVQINALKRPPVASGSERWQLYLITKERNELNELITLKRAELDAKRQAARAFDGADPLGSSTQDYLARLAQYADAAAVRQGHQAWLGAYTAAREASELTSAIHLLTQRDQALAAHHAQQQVVWQAREALWERQRQVSEQRQARIQFKQQADADARGEWVRQANTLSLPQASALAGGWVLTSAGAQVVQGAAAIEAAVANAVVELGRIAAIRTGQSVSLFATAVLYSPSLGNSELTSEQRARIAQGVGVGAARLGLPAGQDLQAIAQAGGSVQLPYRLKLESAQGQTQVIVAGTGAAIAVGVPVVSATHDPLTGGYTVTTPGSSPKYLQFTPDRVAGTAAASTAGLQVMRAVVETLPAGVDTRINDCIVCVPGWSPVYFSFAVPALGTGVVTGTGQPAGRQWWDAAQLSSGLALPRPVGDELRGRQFASFEAFDQSLWRTLGDNASLASGFEEVNRKRLKQGFAPVTPKADWVDGRRNVEVRYPASVQSGAAPYNLDVLKLARPGSALGIRPLIVAFKPWSQPTASVPAPGAQAPASTWTPLVPAGSESLGSTQLPATPALPGILPGGSSQPVQNLDESLPALGAGEANAHIPGFGAGGPLPPPDPLFNDRRADSSPDSRSTSWAALCEFSSISGGVLEGGGRGYGTEKTVY